MASLQLKPHQQQIVKHFKYYSLERKSLKPAGHKELTTQELVDKLAEDQDDPLTHKIVANTVDINARHIKKMLNNQAAY